MIQTLQHSIQIFFHKPNIQLKHYSNVPFGHYSHSTSSIHSAQVTSAKLYSICNPPFLLIYLFIHLPTSILRYSSSIAITTETTLIHLSVSLPSHPVVRNLQFILCPLVFPSLLLSVTLLSIHPSMDVLFSSPHSLSSV